MALGISDAVSISGVRTLWQRMMGNGAVRWILRYVGITSTIFTAVAGFGEALGWSTTAPRLVLSAAVLGLPLAATVAIYHGHLRRDRISVPEGLLLMLLLGGVLFGLRRTYLHLRAEAAAAVPNVMVRFVNPKDPALEFVNTSDALVREVSWVAFMFDIDSPGPVKMIEFRPAPLDWLPAHRHSFPVELKSSLLANPPPKAGDRVYGSVVVGCPQCAREYTYLLALRWGMRGWSAEIPTLRNGQYAHPPALTTDGLVRFAQAIDAAVPPSRRVPLGAE